MYPTMRFADFAEVNPKVELTKGEKYPFVEMAIVTPGRRYVSTEVKRTYKGGGARFQTGDTLFARITPCLEHGKIAQYSGKDVEVGFGSTEFFVFRHRDGISDPGYIAYLAYSDIVRKPAEKSMSGASGRQRADLNTVKDLEIPAPPLPTQRKIAAVLSAYDDLIENNTRRIAILEEMAQLLYREWFVHFRFPGHEQVAMVDSELGLIPERWEVRTVGQFGEVLTGKTPSKKVQEYYGDYMPFIKIPDMRGKIFVTQTSDNLSKAGADSQKRKTLPSNSLCVSCIGSVGLVAITTVPSQTNQQINSIIPLNETDREYLYFALVGLRETIHQYGATGATMSNLSRGKFVRLQVIYPDQETLTAFHETSYHSFEHIRALQSKNEVLRRTRDLLLPRLISGEVDVSNHEWHEWANFTNGTPS
jgi:type I restriction enzyme S subunit